MDQTCRLCQNHSLTVIYTLAKMPIFQNKVFADKISASQVPTADLTLAQCQHCGFVFNATFSPDEMDYDSTYQNEQSHSLIFKNYLKSIMTLFEKSGFKGKKLVEIGCGKGFFLEQLAAAGFDIIGYDPAYTGQNPLIIRDYYRHQTTLDAQIIVLRHVLEHIQFPFEFLQHLANSINHPAKIYIEVPCFEWIINNFAFWDIFHEHCNYFTLDSLRNLFEDAEWGHLFNGQYLYILADLQSFKTSINRQPSINCLQLTEFFQKMQYYRQLISEHEGLYLWGAGAKGVTFANIMDPEAKHISYLIDINPEKQSRYIPKTGHEVINPKKLFELEKRPIIIMNNNYFEEIKNLVPSGFTLLQS